MFWYNALMGQKHHPQTECPTPQICARSAQCFGETFSTPQGLGSIIDSLPMGVIVFDKQLHVVIANSQACRMIDPFGFIHKAMQAATGETAIGSWQQVLDSVVRTGQKALLHSVEILRSGKKILVDIECTALREIKTGDVIGGIVVLQDVTEKYNMHRKLSQSERFAAIGKVAGKVAHELNNPLDGIIRYINLALRSIEARQEEKTVEYLHQSRQGLLRMTNIVKELLEFSRSNYLSSVSAPVSKMIDDAVKTIGSCAENVRINVAKKCPAAAADTIDANLFQVYCNLIKNAVDAMDSEGTLDIEIDSEQGFSIVSFSDTGPGFDEVIAEEIFKPFFTTKQLGSGTGLGLAICRDIVEKNNGSITAENIEGGCRFTVRMPLVNRFKK